MYGAGTSITQTSADEAMPVSLRINQSNPNAELQTRSGTEHVLALPLTPSEREEIWPRLLEHNPMWGAYQSCTERQFAVVALVRDATAGIR